MNLFTQIGPRGHFYECPRWHDGSWWVSDFQGHRVLRVSQDGVAETVVEVENQPSGLGWLPDGSMLVVSMFDRRVLRVTNGVVSVHADLSDVCPGWTNDMCVTSSGNAYVGNFGFDLTDPSARTSRTCLVLVTPKGDVRVVADDLAFPNGCMVTDGDSVLIVNETLASRHTAFRITPDGSLVDRRLWAQIGEPPVDPDNALADLHYAPDGGCLDSKGRMWVGDAWGRRILQIEEGGRILFDIPLPNELSAYACCVGGPNGTTLMIAASTELTAEQRRDSTESVLLLLDVSEGFLPTIFPYVDWRTEVKSAETEGALRKLAGSDGSE